MSLYIGALAQRTGVTRSTLRYYERIGLLAPSGRTAAGYRVFGERALVDLAFIRRAQDLGFTLEEVGEFLRLHRRGDSPCERLVAAARRRLLATERDLERLAAFRDFLADQIASWTACRTDQGFDGPCALIECTTKSCSIVEAVAAPASAPRRTGSMRIGGRRPEPGQVRRG